MIDHIHKAYFGEVSALPQPFFVKTLCGFHEVLQLHEAHDIKRPVYSCPSESRVMVLKFFGRRQLEEQQSILNSPEWDKEAKSDSKVSCAMRSVTFNASAYCILIHKPDFRASCKSKSTPVHLLFPRRVLFSVLFSPLCRPRALF